MQRTTHHMKARFCGGEGIRSCFTRDFPLRCSSPSRTRRIATLTLCSSPLCLRHSLRFLLFTAEVCHLALHLGRKHILSRRGKNEVRSLLMNVWSWSRTEGCATDAEHRNNVQNVMFVTSCNIKCSRYTLSRLLRTEDCMRSRGKSNLQRKHGDLICSSTQTQSKETSP